MLKKATTPSKLRVIAPYKLAFTIAKHKMPFSSCEAFTAFAMAAGPESVVFKDMARSRNTIATKTVELYEKVLRPELTKKVNDSPYWSIMADDSTDSSVCEQCGVYARFIDMQERLDFCHYNKFKVILMLKIFFRGSCRLLTQLD